MFHPAFVSMVFILCLTCFILQANLNDSHNQMVVHWAGEKSNVIVALARDSAGATGPKTSSVSKTYSKAKTSMVVAFYSMCVFTLV